MKRLMVGAIIAALLSVNFGTLSVFAYNPYNIDYSGGVELGASNVQIDPELINSLIPLFKGPVTDGVMGDSNYLNGYIKDGNECRQFMYYALRSHAEEVMKLLETSKATTTSSPYFVWANDSYAIGVSILDTTVEALDDDDYFAFGAIPGEDRIYGGVQVYSDPTCASPDQSISVLGQNDDERIFIEMNIKLYKVDAKDENDTYVANDVFFGIEDIDNAQSFMILNPDNVLEKSNMYAKSAAALQPTSGTSLKNRYSSNGKYIYSEYNSLTGEMFGIDSGSDVYVRLTEETQRNGLDIVFGFAGPAKSEIALYGVKHSIKYNADRNGEITGITGEEVLPGEHASGSSYKGKGKYKFLYWIADVDVVLEDGTVIKAGEPITDEQLSKIVVDKDINFTAVFDTSDIVVPNTGSTTMETNAAGFTLSVAGILLVSLFIRAIPRLAHRRIDFDK